MLDDAATAMVLLLFLSAAVERAVEVALMPLEELKLSQRKRRLLGLGLAVAAGFGLAYAVPLDLVGPLLDGGLSGAEGRTITAIALGGGAAPVHELLRLLEELKKRQKGAA
jgi:hypothetical protein